MMILGLRAGMKRRRIETGILAHAQGSGVDFQ
jgi:hypothetical protein